ncbi:hypothetical protein D3C81_1510270 [compost metagenome]
MQRPVTWPGLAVEDGHVHPVRVRLGGLFHLGLAAGHVGALQVGLIDRLEPAWAAQLHQLANAFAIDNDLMPPPALRFQCRLHVRDELLERLAVLQRGFQRRPNVGQQIEAHSLGDGEGLVVRLVEHVLPVPGDRVAFEFEVSDSLRWLKAKDRLEVSRAEAFTRGGHVNPPGRRWRSAGPTYRR